MRRPILAANWKMYKTVAEALAFARDFLPYVRGMDSVEIVLAPPFTALEPMARALAGTSLKLAAQNVAAHEEGATVHPGGNLGHARLVRQHNSG